MTDLAIKTRDLTKRFGRFIAVNHLNLDVPMGSVFGLLGPNGAGKTTTFSMICGFLQPNEGELTVLGERDLNLVKSRLSALPQDARFHPDRKVEDVLTYLAMLSGMDKPRAKKEVNRVLDAVGMNGAKGLKGKALSHGMAKRIGIAQAFMGRPELVLLDEPTEGLDPRMAHTVRQMIQGLAGQDTTVVISSHNLAEVQAICDHVAIIDQGKLVKAGPLSEIVQANEVVILTIEPGPKDPVGILSGLPVVKTVEQEGNELKITLKETGQSTEERVSIILKTAIDNGIMVGAVKRGHSLEESYLKLT